MNLILKNNKGQSLMEAIVAISVIAIGLVSVTALSHSSLVAQYEAETRVVAANLAREGAEVVHNIRDNNWLAGDVSWDAGLSDSSDYTGIPEIDTSDDWETENWEMNFTPDNFVTGDGTLVYQYTDGVEKGLLFQSMLPNGDYKETPYKRLLTLKAICYDSGSESIEDSADCSSGEKIGIRIISEVRWEEHERSHSLTVEDSVYNWK